MRVWIDKGKPEWRAGVFVGLVMPGELGGCDRCEPVSPLVAVTLDGQGLCLRLFHPSRVTPQPEAED